MTDRKLSLKVLISDKVIKVDPVFELYMARGILFLFRECHSWEVENLEKKILDTKISNESSLKMK